MRITLVPSSAGGSDPSLQFLTTVLVDEAVALDAGCLGLYGSVEQQARVKHVFVSHSHLDHLASLPMFLNTVGSSEEPVTIHGTEPVLECLRRDLFNDRLWPDFLRISAQGRPYLRLSPLVPRQPVTVAGLRVTPIEVNHVVPTTGFLVEDSTSAVLFSMDTGPTEEIWQAANASASLKAVFLEVTFHDELAWLAELSKHLTPSQFGAEARKLNRPVPVIAVHIHPRCREKVVQELAGLGMPNIEVGRFGVPYEF